MNAKFNCPIQILGAAIQAGRKNLNHLTNFHLNLGCVLSKKKFLKIQLSFIFFLCCYMSASGQLYQIAKSQNANVNFNKKGELTNLALINRGGLQNGFSMNDSDLEKYVPVTPTTPSTPSPVYIDFVGSGDIQKSLNQGDEIQANTGLGIIFERFNGEDKFIQSLELETILNIASTVDSITAITDVEGNVLNKRDYGSYIINPVSKKNSIFLDGIIHIGTNIKFLNSLGVNIRYVASNNVWAINKNAQHLGGQYTRVGVFYEFIPDNYRLVRKEANEEGRAIYSLYFGFHRTYRRILGDLSSDDYINERILYLGNDETTYRGYEVNIGFRLRNIRAEFQLPMLNAKNGGSDVRGLTNQQFIFTIRFVGGFGLKLDKTDSE